MSRLLALAVVLMSSVPALAIEVGDAVVVTRRGTLQDEQKVVETVSVGLQLKVLAVDGNRLQVSNGVPGWIDRSFVATPRDAVVRFTSAIKANPRDAELYFARGNVHRSLGELDKATEDLNEAIRLAPQAAAFNGRARVWYERGDYDRALADYDRAIQLSPRSAMLFNNRSAAWEKKGNLDRALADCNQALTLNPKFTFAQNNRTRLASRQSELAGSLAQNAPVSVEGGGGQ